MLCNLSYFLPFNLLWAFYMQGKENVNKRPSVLYLIGRRCPHLSQSLSVGREQTNGQYCKKYKAFYIVNCVCKKPEACSSVKASCKIRINNIYIYFPNALEKCKAVIFSLLHPNNLSIKDLWKKMLLCSLLMTALNQGP